MSIRGMTCTNERSRIRFVGPIHLNQVSCCAFRYLTSNADASKEDNNAKEKKGPPGRRNIQAF
jgi:hypothetical protein